MKAFLVVAVMAALAGAGAWYFTQPSQSDPAIAEMAAKQAAAAFAPVEAPAVSAPAPAPVEISKDAFASSIAASTTPSAPSQAAQAPSANQPQGQANTAARDTMAPKQQEKKIMQATFHTNKGNFTIEFNEADTPNTVANFIKLAKSGFYDGVKFHRVIKGFMIQGGDPLTKDDSQQARWGTGGPGYTFADEIGSHNHNGVGTISMANAGPNTNGSQFFINVAENSFLDTKHTVFGKVVSGMEVVAAIESTPTGAGDRPVQPVTITSVSLQ